MIALFAARTASGARAAIFGVNESHAIAYSIVMNLTTFIACVGAGMYSLWSEGLSLHEIEAVSARVVEKVTKATGGVLRS